MSGAASAAAQTPMSYLQSYGPAADPVLRLNWALLTISIVVSVIIGVLLLIAMLRKRPHAALDEQGRLPVGRGEGGMSWIYIGVGVSTLVLFVCAVWTLMTLSAVAAPHKTPALTLEVTGHQWWWEVRYRSADPTRTLITANEIHIPVGEPVRLQLASGDVIHSFWIPQLAGKTDLIPGQTNVAWLQADKPGDYRGQCAEYCGAQHAHMAVHVIADAPADFQDWWQRQLAEGAAPQTDAVRHGENVFLVNCGVCHTVRGTGAGGVLGPDLTHLMSRQTIAAGLLANNPGSLAGWIANAQALKPGTRMPSLNLSGQDLTAVLAYLETLE